MKIFFRPSVTALPGSVHGARNYGELAQAGVDPDDVVDFSSNCNPYGPHPNVLAAVRRALSSATLNRYPDRDCLALTEAISAVENVPDSCVLPTNGAGELIQLVALAFVAPESRHLVLMPTYGEYTRAILLMGGRVIEHRATRADLRFDPGEIAKAIRALQPAGVWLCNPNNPTGQQWGQQELDYVRRADPEHRTLWVIDESYRSFNRASPPKAAIDPQTSDNTIAIRSLTKDHGVAGLRLGFGLANAGLIEILKTVQPPWSVNSLAQAAGVAAFMPEVLDWRDESLARLHGHADELRRKLTALGFYVLPSSTPYALVNVGNAQIVRHDLLQQGLLVRDCASFGLPAFMRIAAQLPDENERLVEALHQLHDRISTQPVGQKLGRSL